VMASSIKNCHFKGVFLRKGGPKGWGQKSGGSHCNVGSFVHTRVP